MELNESIRFAGDVAIDKVEIISSNGLAQNIANQVIGIEIYEDLFSPFISGFIVIKDSLDLSNLFPFTGEEFLNLKLRTPTYSDKKTYIDSQFYVYKMSNRELVGDKNVAFELHFISSEAVVDLNKKISKTFSGKISDIAKELMTNRYDGLETKKQIVIEPTPNGMKYISNFWSPVKNLNYIAGNAVNASGACDYVFYENRTGFNFNSLEYLYKQPVKFSFVKDNYSRDFGSDGRTIKNLDEDYKRVIDLNIPQLYDYIDRNRTGMFASRLISYDITTKQYVSKNFDMLETFNKTSHLNTYPLVSSKNLTRSNSLIINRTKYYGNFTSYGDVTNLKTIQKRISSLKQAEASKLQITVPGRTDYTVGIKVFLKLYKMSPTSDKDDDIVDTVLTGNYLISAISHQISRKKHECSIELIRDSIAVDLNKGGR